MSRQTKRLFSYSRHDKAVLGYLMRPSWLSGLLCIVISTGVVLWAVFSFIRYNGSPLTSTLQQLFMVGQNKEGSVTSTTQVLGNNFAANTIISDIPLFIFWAGVGLVVYSFASNVVKSLQNAAELTAEMNYINADRRELLITAIEHFVVRAVVLVAWLVLIRYTIHRLIPYAIAVAHVGAASTGKLIAVGYIAGSILLLTVFLHLHTIMLRLLLLKPRVFWQSSYD